MQSITNINRPKTSENKLWIAILIPAFIGMIIGGFFSQVICRNFCESHEYGKWFTHMFTFTVSMYCAQLSGGLIFGIIIGAIRVFSKKSLKTIFP